MSEDSTFDVNAIADSVLRRAICGLAEQLGVEPTGDFTLAIGGGGSSSLDDMVLAVLKAIREPSVAMIDEAYESYTANGGSLRDVFMDMIDALIAEADVGTSGT